MFLGLDFFLELRHKVDRWAGESDSGSGGGGRWIVYIFYLYMMEKFVVIVFDLFLLPALHLT